MLTCCKGNSGNKVPNIILPAAAGENIFTGRAFSDEYTKFAFRTDGTIAEYNINENAEEEMWWIYDYSYNEYKKELYMAVKYITYDKEDSIDYLDYSETINSFETTLEVLNGRLAEQNKNSEDYFTAEAEIKELEYNCSDVKEMFNTMFIFEYEFAGEELTLLQKFNGMYDTVFSYTDYLFNEDNDSIGINIEINSGKTGSFSLLYNDDDFEYYELVQMTGRKIIFANDEDASDKIIAKYKLDTSEANPVINLTVKEIPKVNFTLDFNPLEYVLKEEL